MHADIDDDAITPVPRAPRFAAWDATAAATVVMALSIAFAKHLGIVPVALTGLLWLAAVAWLLGALVARRWPRWSGWDWVLLLGVGLGIVRMASLGILQTVGGHHALYWNVDGRYLATLARGISRFSGAGDTLDYAGSPLRYHAGPSWIAGAFDRVYGIPVDVTLFLVVPVAATFLVAVAGFRLLRRLGSSGPAATVGVVVVLNVPLNLPWLVRQIAAQRSIEVIRAPASWLFSSALIPNALLGLAVALVAAVVVLEDRRWWSALVGCSGVASLLALKPQFLPGLLVLLVPLYVLTGWVEGRAVPWVRLLVGGLWIAALTAVISAANPQVIDFSGIEIHPGAAVRALVGTQDFVGRMIPGAMLLIVVLLVVAPWRRRQPPLLVGAASVTLGSALLAVVVVGGTTLLVPSELVARAHSVGFMISADWIDGDFSQALYLVGAVTVMVAAAQLTTVARSGRGWARWIPGVLVAALVLAGLPLTVSALVSPTGPAGYEVTNEVALRDLIDVVDTHNGTWLSSDLADSAQDHLRPLKAVNISSVGDVQLLLGNVEYEGWAKADVHRRLSGTQRFFTTEWSAWQERFMARHDITHVLVNDRCPPRWAASEFPGTTVGRRGDWTLLAVDGHGGSAGSSRGWPAYSKTPRFGAAPCLAYPSN